LKKRCGVCSKLADLYKIFKLILPFHLGDITNYVSSRLAELECTIAFLKYLSISLLPVDFVMFLVQNYVKNFYGSY